MSTADTLVFCYLVGSSAVFGLVTLIAIGWAVRELWRSYQLRRSVNRFLDSPAARASIADHLRKMKREAGR